MVSHHTVRGERMVTEMLRLRSEMIIRLPCCRIPQHYAIKTSHTKVAYAAPTLRHQNFHRLFSNNGTSVDKFIHKQPPSRLGTCHPSLTSFLAATGNTITNDAKEVESSTLIILTNINERKLLLGKKLRGFGTGKYNGFGGRLERTEVDPTPAHGAKRELMEEANLSIDLEEFVKGSVGTLSFTFQDKQHIEMLVHLFHINVDFSGSSHGNIVIDPNTIRDCDEILPKWFGW